MSDTKEVIRNAVIESASLGLDQDIFLSMWLHLDYGGSGQGFGGYILGGAPSAAAGKHAKQPNYAAEFIIGCLRAADVGRFSDLPGKTIRVQLSEDGLGGKIIAIGHIVKDDRWFNPAEAFESMKENFK